MLLLHRLGWRNLAPADGNSFSFSFFLGKTRPQPKLQQRLLVWFCRRPRPSLTLELHVDLWLYRENTLAPFLARIAFGLQLPLPP